MDKVILEKLNQLEKAIAKIISVMATKDDLKGFATKDDLKNFATKDDLKGFATKDDLKNLPTKDELKIEFAKYATRDELKREFAKYATKDDLKKELKKHATKDDIKRESIKIQKNIIREVTDITTFVKELDKQKAEKSEVIQLEDRVEKIEKELHTL